MRQKQPLSRRSALLAALGAFPAASLLRAQGSPAPVFSSSVEVVNVFATVHDNKGKLIDDLTKDDFQLDEDGRPQTIKYFSRQTDLPLTMGLLVDTSMSERRMIDPEKEASQRFLEDVLRPDKDKAFLIHFDREVELLQDLTSSRQKLEQALGQLDRPEWGHADPDQTSDGGQSGGSQPGGYGRRGGSGRRSGGGGGTAFYDAIYLASDDVLKHQTGRKAIIVLTDGEDRGSKVSMAEAISTAQKSDTLVYAIRIADEERQSGFGGLGGPGMGRRGGWGGGGMGGGMGRSGGMGRGSGPWGGESRADGKKVLQQIARETGGGYFEYSRKKSVGDIYDQIEQELRNQYSIGYTSDAPAAATGFRKIKLTVKKKKDFLVQARDGYYRQSTT